jgi:uncharacterized membrane protein
MIYVYLIMLVLLWTMNPFIKKKIMGNIDSETYFFINHIIATVFVIIYFFYKLLNRKSKLSFTKVSDFSKQDKIYLVIGGLLSVLASRLLPYIISLNKDVTYLISNIQPVVILLTAIIGFAFFNEKIDTKKMMGIGLIIIGLLFMNT